MTRDEYFHELCDLVLAKDSDVSYEMLMRILFEREFRWSNDMDANRARDGLDVRAVYLDHDHSPCSWLEMLIGLAQRMSFIQGGEVSYWFWELIQNLGLDLCPDSKFKRAKGKWSHFVWAILDIVAENAYDFDGSGGIFPLQHPKEDQRNVEIWYQMHAWLEENYDTI